MQPDLFPTVPAKAPKPYSIPEYRVQLVFAITDWSPEGRFLGPFRDVFAAHAHAEGYPTSGSR